MPTYTIVAYDVWGGPPEEDEIQEAWEEYREENADNDDAMTEDEFRENYLDNHPPEYEVNNSFARGTVDIPYDAPNGDILARAIDEFGVDNLEIDGTGDADMISFETEEGMPIGRFETSYECFDRVNRGRVLAYFTHPLLAKNRLIALAQRGTSDKFFFAFAERRAEGRAVDEPRLHEAFDHDVFSLEELREPCEPRPDGWTRRDSSKTGFAFPRLDNIGVIYRDPIWNQAPVGYLEMSLIREPATANVLALILDWWEERQEVYPQPIDGTGMFAVEEYEL